MEGTSKSYMVPKSGMKEELAKHIRTTARKRVTVCINKLKEMLVNEHVSHLDLKTGLAKLEAAELKRTKNVMNYGQRKQSVMNVMLSMNMKMQ